MKILFFGTAVISKDYLENLYNDGNELLVITMPDKPALRGHRITYPLVKSFALDKGLQFIQPINFTSDVYQTIKSFCADVGIAVSYGKLIPKNIFNLPKLRTFNIHFSLLPKYRGAAPVQYALLNGDTETGITSFYIEDGLDTGDILLQKTIAIGIKDNAQTLFDKLIPLGIEVMKETLNLLKSGEINALQQTGEPIFAPAFKKELGLINWSKSAKDIYNHFRGLYIWPGLYSIFSSDHLKYERLKFLDFEIIEEKSQNSDFGKVVLIEKNKGFVVTCAVGKLLITKIQPANKPAMSAWAFILGGKLKIGDTFI